MELSISAWHTRQGVNHGDHAQDVTKAVAIDPTMTVQDLCEATLTKQSWKSSDKGVVREPDEDAYLVIRLAVPVKVPSEGEF